MNTGKGFGIHRHGTMWLYSSKRKPDNSEPLTWESDRRAALASCGRSNKFLHVGWLATELHSPRTLEARISVGRTMLTLEVLRESSFLVASPSGGCRRSFTCGHVSLSSCVKISTHLPFRRMHVIALRAHLDNPGFLPISRFFTPAKIPFLLVCFLPSKVTFPVSWD